MNPQGQVQGPRILSESEIQERLYGAYRQKNSTSSGSGDPEWTGSEILAGELNRLRSELLSLRREREKLACQLAQWGSPPPAAAPLRWPHRFLVVFILLGLAGYAGRVRLLQASPVVVGETTPYTVQVAVYDGQPLAHRATQFLRGLHYDAFLIELPRADGRPRFRVYVGSFVTKQEAELERSRLEGDPRFSDFKDAFVRFR